MTSDATLRSPAALLASEMVAALQELSPESRLKALALATAETLLGSYGSNPTDRVEAYVEQLTATVQEGLKKKAAGTSPARRVPLSAPPVDHLRDWLANEPPGKLQIVLKDQGDLGALLILGWGVAGRPVLFASQYYSDRRRALEGLNRDILEPAGLAPIPYTKKTLEWRLPKPAKANEKRGDKEAPLP